MKTPERIATDALTGYALGRDITREDVWQIVREAIEADRAQIIEDMQERSHPDDWGVPCVYVKSYAERLRGVA